MPNPGVGVRAVCVERVRRTVLVVDGAGCVDKNSMNRGVLALMGNGPFLETLLVCRWVGWKLGRPGPLVRPEMPFDLSFRIDYDRRPGDACQRLSRDAMWRRAQMDGGR